MVSRSRENFVRLAEKRTTRVLHDLELLGNLSNRSNYSYTDEDIKKVFRALSKKLQEVELRFKLSLQGKSDDEFRL